MRTVTASIAVAAALAAPPARAGNPRLAPIPQAQAVSTHGPYEMGACDACHERADPSNPGRPLLASNELCFECHDEFRGSAPVKMDDRLHPSAKVACTTCHSPHNSRKRKLLL